MLIQPTKMQTFPSPCFGKTYSWQENKEEAMKKYYQSDYYKRQLIWKLERLTKILNLEPLPPDTISMEKAMSTDKKTSSAKD